MLASDAAKVTAARPQQLFFMRIADACRCSDVPSAGVRVFLRSEVEDFAARFRTASFPSSPGRKDHEQ